MKCAPFTKSVCRCNCDTALYLEAVYVITDIFLWSVLYRNDKKIYIFMYMTCEVPKSCVLKEWNVLHDKGGFL